MTSTSDRNLLPFGTAEMRKNPYRFYAGAREEEPVYPHPLGFWAITKYEHVDQLLRDRTTRVAHDLHDSCLGADRPKHTRLRRPLSRWFTSRAVQQWRVVAQRHLDDRLTEIAASGGEFEADRDLAFPITQRTICDILGIRSENVQEMRQAIYDVALSQGTNPTEEDTESMVRGANLRNSHVENFVAWKETQPGDGLLDSLIALEKAGELNRDEVVATAILLFAAGIIDVTYLILNGLLRMTEDPSVADAYRSFEGHRGAIIEELLRWDPPEQYVSRLTTQATRVGDVEIPSGEHLLLFIGAANRDPEFFPNPDAFDYVRDTSKARHLAFAAGLHGCAGQVLVRAETDVVFATITQRFGGVRPAGDVEFGHTDFLRCIRRLPLVLGNA